MTDLSEIYEKIGYVFKNESLLLRALTHSSFSLSENYETLEFLGDSVVNYAVSDMLFQDPSLTPGELTKKRASMVSREPLAALSDLLGFSARCFKRNCALSVKMKCDLYEAVTAAIALDGSLSEALAFVRRTILLTSHYTRDYKSELKELCEKHKWSYHAPYTESGTEKNRKFTVEIYVAGKSLAVASDRSVKAAERAACAIALGKLKEK